ncbi:MAG: barstar family protein [Solirubrobacterales bacterium]
MTEIQQALVRPENNGVWIATCEGELISDQLIELASSGFQVTSIDGRDARSVSPLMTKIARGLDFPDYFGANWPAMDECLTDLDWLMPLAGVVVLFTNAIDVLADESETQLKSLANVLLDAVRSFQHPIADGQAWDRPAIPFNVVLQVSFSDVDEIELRWSQAGIDLRSLRA